VRKELLLLSGILAGVLVYLLSLQGVVTFTLREEGFSLRRRDLMPFLGVLEKRWRETPLILEVQGKSFKISKDSLGIRWDTKAMKRKALTEGKVPLLIHWDEERVRAFFASLEAETLLPPRDASWEKDRFVPAREGAKLNTEEAIQKFREELSAWKDSIIIDTFEPMPPKLNTEEALKERGIATLLASFTTSLEGRDEDVVFNIRKAAESISGYLLKKGEAFSFNTVVGKADREDGYRETQILANGHLVPGYGGGVCQVASTLFNALLKTEAEILERHPHSGYSETTSYIPPGLDAAVSYGSKDLRFRFPSQNTVIIAYTEDQTLVCEIWGEKENEVATTITQKVRSLKKEKDDEGWLTVETSIKRDRASSLHFVDTYLVPWDLAQEIVKSLGS
jgi:vancomycin resistance protein YoaR